MKIIPFTKIRILKYNIFLSTINAIMNGADMMHYFYIHDIMVKCCHQSTSINNLIIVNKCLVNEPVNIMDKKVNITHGSELFPLVDKSYNPKSDTMHNVITKDTVAIDIRDIL